MSTSLNEGKDNKRIAKNTVVLYVRMLLVMGLSLYTSRVVLAQLGVTDYGIYNVVGSVVTIFTFISQALGNATNRFIVFSIGEGSIEKTMQVYNTCYRVHVIIAIFVVILLETVGLWFLNGKLIIPSERLTAALYTFHISVAVCFLSIMRVPSTAEVIAHESMGIFAILSVVEANLKLGIAIALVYSTYDKLVYYSILLFVVQLIVNITYHIYCKKNYAECILSLHIDNDKTLYKKVGAFTGWSMLGNITWLAYTQGINILLNMFFGPAVNAARGVANQVEHAITSFVSSFQMAINPQITKSYAQNDMNRMHSLIMYSSKFSFFLYLIFAIPIFFEAENLLKIWLVEVPEHTINFVRLTLIMVMVNPITNPLGISNDSTGNIMSFQIICSLISFQIVIISYFFLNKGFSPEVVFIVHFIIMTIQSFVKLLFAKKQIGLSLKLYCLRVFMPSFTVVLCSAFILFLLYNIFPARLIYVFLYLVLSAIVVICIQFILGLNGKERLMIVEMLKKRIK